MRRVICLALSLVATACTSTLPVPEVGAHEGDPPVTVPYPPPPARVEIIPTRPDNALWVDGQWEWQSRRWVWKAGRWEQPRPGALYAPPTTVRLADGTLAWFEGRWHGGSGGPPMQPDAGDSPALPTADAGVENATKETTPEAPALPSATAAPETTTTGAKPEAPTLPPAGVPATKP